MKIVMGTGASNMRAIWPSQQSVEIKDPIAAAPDISGSCGRAWKCDLAEGRRRMGVRDEDDAALVHWVIEAPWAHPCWHSYSLVMVHLRPMADGRETKFYLPCASHELWLYALDPDADRGELLATAIVGSCWLRPGNFAGQFVELGDADALARVERTVREICDGSLSPDTDFQREWVKRFGDNMIKREFR
jgi:hypothetical protein